MISLTMLLFITVPADASTIYGNPNPKKFSCDEFDETTTVDYYINDITIDWGTNGIETIPVEAWMTDLELDIDTEGAQSFTIDFGSDIQFNGENELGAYSITCAGGAVTITAPAETVDLTCQVNAGQPVLALGMVYWGNPISK